jgi:sulfite reductase beta subunit-like hemoprotein
MANIHVNAAEWDNLTEEERRRISSIMEEHGFLTGSDRIVADASAPPAMQVCKTAAKHLASVARDHKGISEAAARQRAFDWCKAGCNIAEAAAVAACVLVPTPGNIVCVAVAHGGAEFCRSQCE